jgi:hypothetical protein
MIIIPQTGTVFIAFQGVWEPVEIRDMFILNHLGGIFYMNPKTKNKSQSRHLDEELPNSELHYMQCVYIIIPIKPTRSPHDTLRTNSPS